MHPSRRLQHHHTSHLPPPPPHPHPPHAQVPLVVTTSFPDAVPDLLQQVLASISGSGYRAVLGSELAAGSGLSREESALVGRGRAGAGGAGGRRLGGGERTRLGAPVREGAFGTPRACVDRHCTSHPARPSIRLPD